MKLASNCLMIVKTLSTLEITQTATSELGVRTGHGKPGKSWNFQAWKVMEF